MQQKESSADDLEPLTQFLGSDLTVAPPAKELVSIGSEEIVPPGVVVSSPSLLAQ